MNPTQNNFVEYLIPHKQIAPAGQVYLGTFLAFALFFSLFFGNLPFFLIVLIISVFIFLEKEKDSALNPEGINVYFSDNYFMYDDERFFLKDCLSFTLHKELFGQPEKHLRLVFKSVSKQDLFIDVPNHVQTAKLCDIIRKSVKEDLKKELSFSEQLVLRFF